MSGAKRKKENERTEEEEKYQKFYTDLQNLPLEYNEDTLGFREFANTFRFPQMFTICKGEYRDYGYPTGSNPGQTGWFFAWCRRDQCVVKAQCIQFSPSRRMLTTRGGVFEITDDYKGKFEIISQNGHAVEHIRSVSELSKHWNKFFVAMKSVPDALKYSPENGWENCTLDIGTTIRVDNILSDITELPPRRSGRLLKCWTTTEIFLPLNNNNVRFAAFRFETDGVMLPQTVRSIAKHFGFPINVRLLEGSPPPAAGRDFRSTIRLHEHRTEDVLTAWPLARDGPKALVNIPLNSEIEVRLLKDLKTVRENPVYKEIIEWIKLLKPPPPQSKIINFQPSTSGLQRTAIDINQPSTSGLQGTAIDINQQSTSGLQGTAIDIQQPSTSGLQPTAVTSCTPQPNSVRRSSIIASAKDNTGQKTSGTSTAQPYTIHRSFRNKRKEDHETSTINTVPEGRIPTAEPTEDQQTEGLAKPNRFCRSLMMKSPLKHADEKTPQQSFALACRNLPKPDNPSITDPDEIMYINQTSSKDPYDEIDEIYEDKKKLRAITFSSC